MSDLPLVVKLSGGRSSAMMLRLLLDAGRLDFARDKVIFTNTGAEHPGTLDFVRDIGLRWDVPVVWLEYFRDEEMESGRKESYRVVDWASASRKGEPFMSAMTSSHCAVIPKTTERVCTSKLKITPTEKYLSDAGVDDYVSALGYRKGEERRRSRALGRGDNIICPLMEAGIDNARVIEFWRAQDFNLSLPTVGGRTIHGNCVLCFMKGRGEIMRLINECPTRADFWIALEDALEEKRNQPECRWWLNRGNDSPHNAWKKCEPPDEPTEYHRQDGDGQWWVHDGRWHKVSILQGITYREMKEGAARGDYLRLPQRNDKKHGDLFLDDPNPSMPCECGD